MCVCKTGETSANRRAPKTSVYLLARLAGYSTTEVRKVRRHALHAGAHVCVSTCVCMCRDESHVRADVCCMYVCVYVSV